MSLPSHHCIDVVKQSHAFVIVCLVTDYYLQLCMCDSDLFDHVCVVEGCTCMPLDPFYFWVNCDHGHVDADQLSPFGHKR